MNEASYLVALKTWLLAFSLAVAHALEPKNPVPRPMPARLADVMLAETGDTTKLARLAFYAFAEGGYSLDPHLPGDCHGMPAGSRACTVQAAKHFCTLQVEPMPKDLEECVHRARVYMDRSLESYTGSALLASIREGKIARLLGELPPPARDVVGLSP